MTRKEATEEYHKRMDRPVSTTIASDMVSKQLEWFDWIAEHELDHADSMRFLKAAKQFYVVLRQINCKYIDGE